MRLADTLISEFDTEMANTRKTLERVPGNKLDWRPHHKSTTMGGLATHLATLPTWAVSTVELDSLDLAPKGGPIPLQPPAKSTKEALEAFDKNVAAARAAIVGASLALTSRSPVGRSS